MTQCIIGAANPITWPDAIVLGLAIVIVGALVWRLIDRLL